MIKISKELKAGVATLVILALFYWGFSFMKGRNLFDGGVSTYYAVYKNVNGLKPSSPVIVSGMTVGSVSSTVFSTEPSEKGKIIVAFTVKDDIQFSKNSLVKIQSNIMGGSYLVVVPSYKGATAESGDYLTGKVEPTLITNITGKLNPLQAQIGSVTTHLDSVLVKLNSLLDTKMTDGLKESLNNLNETMKSVKSITSKVDGDMDDIMTNVKESTANLNQFSDSLKKVQVVEISNKLNQTLSDLNSITSDIQNGKGTIGLLAKDEKLYNNLEAATKELEELLRDVKEHPKRFVHFSLFGKKEKSYKEPKEN
ncbi:MlaD family protein [Wenyingzhuangia sp. IMCC45574]